MTYEGARSLVGPWLGLLGASAAVVGFAAGFGEFLGYGLRLLSGWLADRTRAFWGLVLLGYGVNLVAVPGLALVGSWQAAVALVLLERAGKALRSPAKSTLMSYAAAEVGAGWTFGVEEALDQIGAVSGPLLAAFAIWVVRDEPIAWGYRVAFAVLLLPVLANLALALLARRRFPAPESFEPAPSAPLPPGPFRAYMLASALLGLGFVDWALVAYHAARTEQIGLGLLPVLYAAVMAADGLSAFGLGVLFDRNGLVVLAGSALVSALCAPLVFLEPSGPLLLVGALLWAIGMGAQDSIFKAGIATMVPKHERARAYGVFFAVVGFAWWLGSAFMGWLYDQSLPALAAFSTISQTLAALAFLALHRAYGKRPAI
jgi:MFS family permease